MYACQDAVKHLSLIHKVAISLRRDEPA